MYELWRNILAKSQIHSARAGCLRCLKGKQIWNIMRGVLWMLDLNSKWKGMKPSQNWSFQGGLIGSGDIRTQRASRVNELGTLHQKIGYFWLDLGENWQAVYEREETGFRWALKSVAAAGLSNAAACLMQWACAAHAFLMDAFYCLSVFGRSWCDLSSLRPGLQWSFWECMCVCVFQSREVFSVVQLEVVSPVIHVLTAK